ncbi:unnamed protein product [Ascophyllum nodosum]
MGFGDGSCMADVSVTTAARRNTGRVRMRSPLTGARLRKGTTGAVNREALKALVACSLFAVNVLGFVPWASSPGDIQSRAKGTYTRCLAPPRWSRPRAILWRRHRGSPSGTTRSADRPRGIGVCMETGVSTSGGHRVETDAAGASVLKVTIGGRELTFETGKIGRQASGAVMARDGDTVVYSTACTDKKSSVSDFAPLRVDYMERFSAAGMTSGGYNKRDGRASDKETLVSRLMDRPLRPAMHPGWNHETQLLSWVLSYDNTHPPVPLAITAASAALALSNVPLVRAIAGVTVGLDGEGELVVNPEMAVAAMSRLNLTIAGTAEGVLMIEGESDFVSEEEMIRAIEVGHNAVKELCAGIEAWSSVGGKEKKTDTLRAAPEGLYEAIADAFQDKVDEALFCNEDSKGEQSSAMSELTAQVKEAFAAERGAGEGSEERREDSSEETYSEGDVLAALKKLCSTRLRRVVMERGLRCDGRRVDEVRPITIATPLLPRTHGSCLFTRGDTQAIATVTLGGSGDSQKTDGITGMVKKHFYLQYTFPPSCIGETGRTGAPGRREVGHGALAEKALSYTVPGVREFPYTIRVESLITESCGSSSMASVCGGSLAMMDAGIPVSSPIAGIAMGLLLDEGGGGDEDAVVLTDILGIEDALGTMDFKVAGNEDGITAFQLDIKCSGLTTALLGRALMQAKTGRLKVLEEMKKALPDGPRDSISPFVPAATVMNVEVDQIGKIIGPGGKTIRQIIEDFELDGLDVEDDGRVMISSYNSTRAASAKKYVEEMLKDASLRRGGGNGGGASSAGKAVPRGVPADFNATEIIGNTYRDCEVKAIHAFGCFVEFLPGLEGLVHVSELDVGRVVTAEGFLADKSQVDVKVIGLNEKGKVRLSRRAVILDDRGPGKGNAPKGAAAVRPRQPSGNGLGVVGDRSSSQATVEAATQAEAIPVITLVDAPSGGASMGRDSDVPPPRV